MNTESIIAVAEDLAYLACWTGDIPEPEIRRGTAVLRRLLIEDAYGAAWRAIGRPKQPAVIAVDLNQMLGGNVWQIHVALAGGACFRGVQIGSTVGRRGGVVTSVAPAAPIRANGYPFDRQYTLSDFLASPAGIVDDRPFTRREVIRYIANVKGGVHLSTEVRKSEAKLVERLSRAEKRIRVQHVDGLLVEVVAIAQALGSSEDAKSFMHNVLEVRRNS